MRVYIRAPDFGKLPYKGLLRAIKGLMALGLADMRLAIPWTAPLVALYCQISPEQVLPGRRE